MKKKVLSSALCIVLAYILVSCGSGVSVPESPVNGTSLSGTSVSETSDPGKETGKTETVSTEKEEVLDSVTAKRSIIAESITGIVQAYLDDTSYTLVAGDKLESGSYIRTYTEDDLTMLLDMDKHVYAGNDTKLHLVAEGKTGSTRTRIDLLEGILECGIDNKLGDEESFGVNTPNATMAVRGTVFTVTVTKDDKGRLNTDLSVTQGAVETVTIEDGEEKTLILQAGETRSFTGETPEKTEVPDHLIADDFVDIRSFSAEDRFAYYRRNTGSDTTYRVLRGTIRETEKYFKDVIAANKGAHDINYDTLVLVYSEPVTVEDGAVLEYSTIGFSCPHDDIPYDREIEFYGLFMPEQNPEQILNAVLFGADTWGFCVEDYMIVE